MDKQHDGMPITGCDLRYRWGMCLPHEVDIGSSLRNSPLRRLLLTQGFALALTAMASGNGWAAQTDLGKIGLTQLQQDTGEAVQLTCGGFVAAGTVSGTVPLFDTCSAMVNTAKQINNTGGSTSSSLGLSRPQLAAALQEISNEEFGATGSMANEIGSTQVGNIMARILAIRGGARGFSVAGFSPVRQRPTFTANTEDLYPGEIGRGGGASADALGGKLGAFLYGNYGTGDRGATDRVDKFKYDTHGITAGMDYRFSDELVYGGALSYHKISSDFSAASTVSGGGVDASSWGGFVYGTYYIDRFYVDGLAGYGQANYDITRRIVIPSNNSAVQAINDTAKGSPSSNDTVLNISGGYNATQRALTYGPYARLSYSSVNVDGYRETGAEASGLNLNVQSQDWESLTTVLGGQFSFSSSQKFGVVIPEGRIGWVHEFKNSSQQMKATYVDDPLQHVLLSQSDQPDRDYFELGLGVSTVLQGGLQLMFNYDTVLGFSNLTDHLFTIGARQEL